MESRKTLKEQKFMIAGAAQPPSSNSLFSDEA
jgi:hypothetical protein